MAEAVDSIIVELIARVGQYQEGFKQAVASVDAHTAAIERNNRAESKAEAETGNTRKRRTSAEAQAAREEAAIKKQAAKETAEAEKAAAKAASDAVKLSTREQTAAVRAAEREKQTAIKETERVRAESAAADERSAVRMANIDATLAAQATRSAGTRTGPLKGAGNNDGPQRPLASSAAAYINGVESAAAVEREINHVLADRATLQAGLVASTREEQAIIRDQLTQIRLLEQFKRAGLSDSEAAIRAEETLSGLEARRVRQAEALATAQAAAAAKQQAALEKQLHSQSGKVANGVSLFIPALVGGVGVHELSEINDEYIRFSNSLKVAGVSTLAFSDVQDHLLRTSTRTGAEIGSLADTYRSIALASHDLGASGDEILKVTDAVANSLRITGASGGAARAAILQLGHAFETGKVTAREFNGLALNAYPLLQAAAAGSDKFGGSVAKLRASLIAGDLSSKDFFDAILKGSDTLEGRANKAALTTAQGFTALRNALVVYVGSADQADGVSAALGSGLQKVAENLDILIPAIGAVGVALTVGYVTRAIEAATASETLGAALLGAFGGPVGLAVTALTLSIAGFYTEIARHDAVIARVNQSFDDMQARLRVAGDQAGIAASQTAGVGTSAQSAIPGVESLTGKVRGLADELYRQADAAKRARIETAAKAVADADRQERAAQAELPAARDNADSAQPGGIFNMRNWGSFYRSAVGGANNLFNNGAPDQEAKVAYAKAVAVSQQARRDLAAAYQGANGGGAEAPTDPKVVKALANLNDKLNGLETLADSATGQRLDHIKSQIEKTKQKITDIEHGASPAAANAAESGGTGRRGPTAETLARRQEATRLKAVHDDEGYTTALKQAHDQELQASIDLTNDTMARTDLERQRVRDAATELADNIRKKGPKDPKLNDGVAGTGERTADETNTLLGINSRTRDLKLAGIDLAQRRQDDDDARALSRAEIETRREALQSRQQENLTLAERKRLALELLDLDYQLREADLQAVAAADSKASQAERTIAINKLSALPDQKAEDERNINRQTQGAGAAYLEGLRFDKPQFVQSEEVKLLDDFNRGLDDSVKKALHLHGIFGDIVGDLVDMAIKQALLKPIANALFGGGGDSGSGGGGIGGFLGTILGAFGSSGGTSAAATNAASFSLPGFAAGGSGVFGGNPGIDQNTLSMNGKPFAKVGRGETFSVSPNVAASNKAVASQAMSPIIIAPQHYDLSGVVMTESLVAGLREDNRRYADQVGKAAVKASGAQTTGILQRKQVLGS